MSYRCDPVRLGLLSCEFTETAVRLKASNADLLTRIETSRRDYKVEPPMSAEQCKGAHDIDDMLSGRKPSTLKPDHEPTAVEKADYSRTAKVMVAYCDKPSEQTFLSMARDAFDKDHKTCQVSSRSWKQDFRLAQQLGNQPFWVAQGSPNGPCGTVDLSRFETAAQAVTFGGKAINFSMWNFVRRKTVTTPGATPLPYVRPELKCSATEEAAIEFEFRGNDRQRQTSCDYIEFVPPQFTP